MLYTPDRQQYERDLRRRQKEHMDKVLTPRHPWQPCIHDGCSECHGTGIKINRQPCIHAISCPCPRCSPYSL
jgi:hypothetical protein